MGFFILLKRGSILESGQYSMIKVELTHITGARYTDPWAWITMGVVHYISIPWML